jgi:hypothetical protein
MSTDRVEKQGYVGGKGSGQARSTAEVERAKRKCAKVAENGNANKSNREEHENEEQNDGCCRHVAVRPDDHGQSAQTGRRRQ